MMGLGLPSEDENRLPLDAASVRLIDIEMLVQWALAQTGYLPWRAVTERELAYDHGYTAIPHGVGHQYRGGGVVLRAAISDDANTVIGAIKALEPQIAATVIACGRKQIRPDWLPGVEPKRSAHYLSPKKHGKRRHRRKTVVMVWNIDPLTIKLVRGHYEAWHDALTRLARRLAGQLQAFEISGFAAARCPWETENIANRVPESLTGALFQAKSAAPE
jgi:hypothetical protein